MDNENKVGLFWLTIPNFGMKLTLNWVSGQLTVDTTWGTPKSKQSQSAYASLEHRCETLKIPRYDEAKNDGNVIRQKQKEKENAEIDHKRGASKRKSNLNAKGEAKRKRKSSQNDGSSGKTIQKKRNKGNGPMHHAPKSS
ncbi:hypothetical protein PIB30_052628 [Stylosanthes scabra]|uniref:DUF4283 domain-containing protein n=1 Tax=Stylosanthes scabra TaxID=79078 RepID=A0ABU6VHI3_9FABA|nr:hypothetical protein [Stylosanthes scabra]